MFFFGPEPQGERYDNALGRLVALGPGYLPQGGGPPIEASFPHLPAVALATLGPLAFLAGAAFLWRRGEPPSG